MWSRGGKEGVIVFCVSLIVIILSFQLLRYNDQRQKRLISEIDKTAVESLCRELLQFRKRVKMMQKEKKATREHRRKKKRKSKKRKEKNEQRSSMVQKAQRDSFSEAAEEVPENSSTTDMLTNYATKNENDDSCQTQFHPSLAEKQGQDDEKEKKDEQHLSASITELIFSVLIC